MASEGRFDLVVIGSGPGGYTAAIRAAQLGMKVACVEKDPALGGTCLNIGCIPSKALLDSSEYYHMAGHSFAKHGIQVKGLELDLPAMMKRKDQVVTGLTSGVAGLFKKNKVEWVKGAARLRGAGKVVVGDRELATDKILIATGSEPIALPTLPFDGKRILSSTEALSLPEVPGKLLVIGAGAIGLELGSVWNRLGSEVVVVEFTDRIMPAMDAEMTAQLKRSLEKQGLVFRMKTKAESAKVEKKGVRVTLSSEGKAEEETCDYVLVAIGRKAYTAGLGLESVGLQTDNRGRVPIDAHFRTPAPGVYAIGDVVQGPMLAHKASEEGVAAVERMAGQAGHVNYLAIPNVVYTYPELASVGLTEEEAKEKGIEYRVGKFPFMATGRAKALDATEGLVKIVGDARTDRLLGMHILGARASDLIAEGAVAIEFASSVEDIARASHAHPTMPEAIKEAALAVHKRTINF